MAAIPRIEGDYAVGSDITTLDSEGRQFFVLDKYKRSSIPTDSDFIHITEIADPAQSAEAGRFVAEELREEITALPGPAEQGRFQGRAAGLHWHKDRLYAIAAVAKTDS